MDTCQINNSLLKFADTASYVVKESNFFTAFFNIIIALCFVIGIMFLIMILIKKYGGRKFLEKFVNKEDASCSLRIISKVSLGHKKFLYVVKLNDNYMLLGVTDCNINLITQFNDKPDFADDLDGFLEDKKNE